MPQAKMGDTVKVHYTGRLDDGTVFDSSREREPLEFTLGQHQVIPGFEEAALGMEVGDTKTVRIPADEAYGQHREEMIATFPREQFPADMPLNVGDQLQLRTEEGHPLVVKITASSDAEITLDGNHPLAGQALTFDIELVSIA